jgi:hypothetical protein
MKEGTSDVTTQSSLVDSSHMRSAHYLVPSLGPDLQFGGINYHLSTLSVLKYKVS